MCFKTKKIAFFSHWIALDRVGPAECDACAVLCPLRHDCEGWEEGCMFYNYRKNEEDCIDKNFKLFERKEVPIKNRPEKGINLCCFYGTY